MSDTPPPVEPSPGRRRAAILQEAELLKASQAETGFAALRTYAKAWRTGSSPATSARCP